MKKRITIIHKFFNRRLLKILNNSKISDSYKFHTKWCDYSCGEENVAIYYGECMERSYKLVIVPLISKIQSCIQDGEIKVKKEDEELLEFIGSFKEYCEVDHIGKTKDEYMKDKDVILSFINLQWSIFLSDYFVFHKHFSILYNLKFY